MVDATDIEATMASVGASEASAIMPGVRAPLPFAYSVSALVVLALMRVERPWSLLCTFVYISTPIVSFTDTISASVSTRVDVEEILELATEGGSTGGPSFGG